MPDPPVRPVTMTVFTLVTVVMAATLVSSAPMHDHLTQMEEYYGGSSETGCYYNFLHYEEGDRIMTNEPCLNCTCHNRMLMCYLRVCPFTKAIGQDCTIEKKPDQCCPVITCPEVPVHLLTSSTTAITPPAPTGSTALGLPDNYGCSINEYFYTDGAQVPGDPSKPCELCYCIRNKTACVMQECTLQVEGCRPVYQEGVCCPVRYDCDYQIDVTTGLPLLETTVHTTPGLLLTTTTAGPLDCIYEGDMFGDGASIRRVDKPCEHCYCMRGEIVCAVQECGTPLEKEAKNCTPLPPEPGKCCPQQYQCDTKIVHVNDLYLRQNRKHENTENDNTTIPFEIMSQEKETTPHPPTHDVSTSGPTKEAENVAVTEATVVEQGPPQEHTDQHENVDQDIESQEHLNEVDHSDHETHGQQEPGQEPVVAEGEIEHEVDHHQHVTQGVEVHSTHGITATTKEHRTTTEEVEPTESIVHVTESAPEGSSSQSSDISETTPGLSVTSHASNAENEPPSDTTHDAVSGSDVSHDMVTSEHSTEGMHEVSSEEPEKFGDSTAEQTTEPAQVGHQTTPLAESLPAGSEGTDAVPGKPSDDTVHFPVDVESVTEPGAESTTSQKEKVSEMTVLPVVAEGEPSETATGPSHAPSLETSSSGTDGEVLAEVDQGTTIANEVDVSTQPSAEVHPVKPSEDDQTTGTEVEKNPNETPAHSEETVTKEDAASQAGEVTPSGIIEATTVSDAQEEEISEPEKTTAANLGEEPTVVPAHGAVGGETTIKPQHEVTSDAVSETSTKLPITDVEKPVEAVEHETGEHVPTDTSVVVTTTTEKSQQPIIEEAQPTTADELLHQPVESEPSSATEGSANPIATEQSPEHEMGHEVSSPVSHPAEAVEEVTVEEMHKPENIVTTAADMETATEQMLEGGLITTIKENLVASSPVSDNQVTEEEPAKQPESGHEETSPVVTEESHKEVITTTASSVPVTPEGITHDSEHLDHTNPAEDMDGQIHHVTSEINGKPTEITATSSEEMSHKPTPQVPAQEPEAVTLETVVPSSPSVPEIHTEAPASVPDKKPDSDNLLNGEHESTGGYVPEVTAGVTESGPAGIELTTAEHGLIPGEGNCLVDGVTYANNSDVPPAGQCHLSCRCVSSIVHCESITCPPPPPHFTNCMPIQHGEGSCCPTYTCDGDNKVTLESDSHLAGTESPTGETKHPSDDTPAAEQETLKPEHVEDSTTAKPHPVQTEEQPESPVQPSGSDENETDQNQVEQKPEAPVLPTETESEATPDKEVEHTDAQAPVEDKTDAPVTANEEKPVEPSEKEPDQTSENVPVNGGAISTGGTEIPTVEPLEVEKETDRPLTPVVAEPELVEPVHHETEGSGQQEHATTDIPEHDHSTPKQPEDQQITSTPDAHTPEDLSVPSEASLPAEPVSNESEGMVQTTPRQPTEVSQGQENVESSEQSTPSSEVSDDKLTTAAELDLKPTGSTVESDEQPTESNQQAVEHETSTEQQQSHSSEAALETHEEQTEHPLEQPTVPEADKPNESVDQTTAASIGEDNEVASQVTESDDAVSISNEPESKPHEEPVTPQGVDGQVSTQEPNTTAPAEEKPATNDEMQHGQTNPSEAGTEQTAAPPSVEGDKQTQGPEETSEQPTVGPSEDVTEHQATIPQGETDDQQAVISPEENEEQQTTGTLTEEEVHQPSVPHDTEEHTVGSVTEAPTSSTAQEEHSPQSVEAEISTEPEMAQIVTTTVASSLPENDVEHGDKTEIPPEVPSEPSVVDASEKEPAVTDSSTEAGDNQNVPTEYPHEMAEGSTPAAVEAEGGQDQHPAEHEEQTSDNILESDEMLPVSPSQEQDLLSAHDEETTADIVAAQVEHSTDEPGSEEVVTEVDKTPQAVSSEGDENQKPIVEPVETEGSTQPAEVHVSEMEGDNQSAQVTSTEKVESVEPQEPESQAEIEKEPQGVTTESLPEENNEIEKETVPDEILQHATLPTLEVTSKGPVEITEHEEISIVTVMPEKEHSIPAIESMLGQGHEMTSSSQYPHVVTESSTLPGASGDVTDSPQQVEGVHPGTVDSEHHPSSSAPVEPVVHEEVTTQAAEKPGESTEKDTTVVIQEEIQPTGELTEADEHPTAAPVETENQVDTQTESQQVNLSSEPEITSQFETVHTEKPLHPDITTTEGQEVTATPGAVVESSEQTVQHGGEESVPHQPALEGTSGASSEQPIDLIVQTTESDVIDQQEVISEANIPAESGEKLPQEPVEVDTGKPSDLHSTAQPELPEVTEKPAEEKPVSSHPAETSEEPTEVPTQPDQHETVSESHPEKEPSLSEQEEAHQPPAGVEHVTDQPETVSESHTEKEPSLTEQEEAHQPPAGVEQKPDQPETASESHTEKEPSLTEQEEAHQPPAGVEHATDQPETVSESQPEKEPSLSEQEEAHQPPAGVEHATNQPETPSESHTEKEPSLTEQEEAHQPPAGVEHAPDQHETVSESHTEKEPSLTEQEEAHQPPASVEHSPDQHETATESHTEKEPSLTEQEEAHQPPVDAEHVPDQHETVSESHTEKEPSLTEQEEAHQPPAGVEHKPDQPETVSESHTEKEPSLTEQEEAHQPPVDAEHVPDQHETVSESHTEKQPSLTEQEEAHQPPVDAEHVPDQHETVSESHTEKYPSLTEQEEAHQPPSGVEHAPDQHETVSESHTEKEPSLTEQEETHQPPVDVEHKPDQPETVSESHTEKEPSLTEQEAHQPPAGVEHAPDEHETVTESQTEREPSLQELEAHQPLEGESTLEPDVTTVKNIISTDHASAGEHDNEQVTETVHTSSKATLSPDSLVTEEETNQTHPAVGDSATGPDHSTEGPHAAHETDGNKVSSSTFNTPAPIDEKVSTSAAGHHDDAPVVSSSTEAEVTASSEEASTESGSHLPHTTASPTLEHYTTEGHASIPGEGIEHVTEGTKKPAHHFTTRPPVPEDHHRPGQTSEEQFEQFPTSEGDYQVPSSGGETDFGDEDQDQASFGSGTCRYGGKMYVSAQQIPRDDPCDFCFCFRSDIICLQQSCPPPIHGCHEEPIQGFCCPRYECPVSMAMVLNTTTTTTTTTTALPPHFLPHVYGGAVQRTGCQVQGHAYRVGEIVHSASGPCLQCRCGGNGQMECNPKECSPEPMLRKMIMAAGASRRR